MLYKNLMEFAARGGIVGGTVIMTKYFGMCGTEEDYKYILKRVKVRTIKCYQLAKKDLFPNLDMKLDTKCDKMVKTYNNGIEKTIGLIVLTPDIVANFAVTANKWTLDTMWPKISEIMSVVKFKISEEVAFIKELQFPGEHGEEGHGENEQSKITEDLAHQEGDPSEAMTELPVEKKDDEDNGDKDDMGLILGAVTSTLQIMDISRSLTDIRKKFNS